MTGLLALIRLESGQFFFVSEKYYSLCIFSNNLICTTNSRIHKPQKTKKMCFCGFIQFFFPKEILFNLIIVSQFHSEDQVMGVRVVLMPSRQKHGHNKRKAAESASLDPFHLIGQRGSEKEGR